MCWSTRTPDQLLDAALPESGYRRRLHYLQSLGIRRDTAPPKAADGAGASEEPARLAPSQQAVGVQREAAADGGRQPGCVPGGAEDFRMAYLRKLSYSRIWTPVVARPPKHQTVSIFDWDDTILPTSYVTKGLPRPEAHLKAIEQTAGKLLELARRAGRVFIITNATPSWVERSAEQFLPGLMQAIRNVPIISARGEFETLYPGEVDKWKVQAFLKVREQLDSQVITNLISVGDSIFEMNAVHVMGREFAQAIVKTVKFRENPTAKELRKELELVANKFEQIVAKAQDLTITLANGPRRKAAQGARDRAA